MKNTVTLLGSIIRLQEEVMGLEKIHVRKVDLQLKDRDFEKSLQKVDALVKHVHDLFEKIET